MSAVAERVDDAQELTTVTGVVKWFNSFRGYGFVGFSDGRKDAMLHVTCLKKHGHETIADGSTITCEVTTSSRGGKVQRIISINKATARTACSREIALGAARPSPGDGFVLARVKHFNGERGYGHLSRPDQPDIFVHTSLLDRYGIRTLTKDQMVFVKFEEGKKGLTATEIVPQ